MSITEQMWRFFPGGSRLSWRHVLDKYSAWLQWQRERDQLLTMGDQHLRDIGLTRTDAVRLARRSWRPR